MKKQKWFTPEEVGELLGKHRLTIQRYIREGIIKAYKMGGGKVRPRWEIAEKDLQEFLTSRKNG